MAMILVNLAFSRPDPASCRFLVSPGGRGATNWCNGPDRGRRDGSM